MRLGRVSVTGAWTHRGFARTVRDGPGPAALTARTERDRTFPRTPKTRTVDLFVAVHAPLPARYWYVTVSAPPLSAGPRHVTRNPPLIGTALRAVTAPGFVIGDSGVTGLLGADGGDVPAAFDAVTVNV